MRKLLWLPVLVLGLVATTAQAVIIEDFEDGDWDEYVAVGTVQVAVTGAAARHGSYGLEIWGHSGAEGWIYRDDAQVTVGQGNVVGFWTRTMEVLDNYTRNYLGFGATAGGCYSAVIGPNTGTFILQYNSGYGYTTLIDTPVSWQLGHWYYVEIDWQVGGTIIATCYDGDTMVQVAQISTVHTAITSGGIAFRSFDSGHVAYFDSVSRDGGYTPIEDSTWGQVKALFR